MDLRPNRLAPAFCGLAVLILAVELTRAVAAEEKREQPQSVVEPIPSAASPEQAAQIFKLNLRRWRAQQRSALARAADKFAAQATREYAANVAGEKAAAAVKVRDILRGSSDVETAMLLAMQLRSQLEAPLQSALNDCLLELSPTLETLKQIKLNYRPFLATKMAHLWTDLPLREKQSFLEEYLFLGGEPSEWLQRGRFDAYSNSPKPMPIGLSAARIVENGAKRLQNLLRAAEQAFAPQRSALLAELSDAAISAELTEEQKNAARKMLAHLQADYGQGFRGLMLFEVDERLPSKFTEHANNFYRRFHDALDALKLRRESELAKIKQELAKLQAELLRDRQFVELFAIDLRLEQLRQYVRPLWIFAVRDSTAQHPENALLLDVSDDRYLVSFAIDRKEHWLTRQQLWLRPTPELQPRIFLTPVPAIGPGTPLGEDDALEQGDGLLCFRQGIWHPVTIVDTSPFGVVIQWDGYPDSSTQIEPREKLRKP